MKRVLLLVILIASVATFAQTDKQIDKAIKIFKKDYSKGIAKLDKYMDKESFPRLRAWEVKVEMEYLKYLERNELWSNIFVNIETDSTDVVEVVDETSDTITSDTTETIDFMTLLMEMPKTNFLNVCRQATILSESYSADYYYRTIEIEKDPDTLIAEKAVVYFDEGMEFFEKKDFELAIMNFKKAIKEDANYYKANLNLGLAFWNEEESDSALFYFNQAKNLQPIILTPRDYIIQVLVEEGLYFRAKKECLDALCIYPGFDVKLAYLKVLYVENKYMDDNRILRSFYPNNMRFEEQRELNGTFSAYRAAKNKISKYCNEDGIIEENGKTDDMYLEVYSWRQLLNNLSNSERPDYLDFAKEMEEDGYLDCYVFLSQFHVDIYPQFKHFMSFEKNRERTKEYIEKYLIKTYDN